jgi:hypothetical protein
MRGPGRRGSRLDDLDVKRAEVAADPAQLVRAATDVAEEDQRGAELRSVLAADRIDGGVRERADLGLAGMASPSDVDDHGRAPDAFESTTVEERLRPRAEVRARRLVRPPWVACERIVFSQGPRRAVQRAGAG